MLNEEEGYCFNSRDFFHTDINLIPDIYGKRYLETKR
jgi:hypothetical protein